VLNWVHCVKCLKYCVVHVLNGEGGVDKAREEGVFPPFFYSQAPPARQNVLPHQPVSVS